MAKWRKAVPISVSLQTDHPGPHMLRHAGYCVVRPALRAGRTGRRLDAGRSAAQAPNSRLERTPAWALRARRATLSRRPVRLTKELLERATAEDKSLLCLMPDGVDCTHTEKT